MSSRGTSRARTGAESRPCGKVGLGVDLFATEHVSFGIEGDYVLGFDDLNYARYTLLTAGLTYHF